MKLESLSIAGKTFLVPSHREVENLEKDLGVTLPAGYAEYVERFGAGSYACRKGGQIRIYVPSRILRSVGKGMGADYALDWEDGHLLEKVDAHRAIQFGDTSNGDVLFAFPNKVDVVYVMGRDEIKVYRLDGDLWVVLQWLTSSGKTMEPFRDPIFIPFEYDDLS